MGRLKRPEPRIAKLDRRVGFADDASADWKKLYTTTRWRKLAWQILARDLFTCRRCGRLEGDRSKLACDHIKPHHGNMKLFWDTDNLQCLCRECHDTVKREEDRVPYYQRGVWD